MLTDTAESTRQFFLLLEISKKLTFIQKLPEVKQKVKKMVLV